ncbi:MAG TPA: hypothetical protein VM487_03355 [Phycisphaerae bacterium]|nr:hypothetical protein [Phycisphaerae bacterium]
MVYETENLRVRLETPPREPGGRLAEHDLRAPLIVENRRPVMAWIDARRSCVIDPERGAENLLFTDAILPGNNWTRLARLAPSFITINMSFWPERIARVQPASEAEQRVLLHVVWDDGQSELADLTYQVTVQ